MIIRNRSYSGSYITAALLCFLFVPTLAALEHNHSSNSNSDIFDSILALKETDSTSNTKRTADHFLTNHDSTKDSIGRELPQDDADEEYDPNSTTITNNVEWKDNNGDPLQNGRGGKLARIDRTWYWIGSQSSSSGIWVSNRGAPTLQSILCATSIALKAVGMDDELIFFFLSHCIFIYFVNSLMVVLFTFTNQPDLAVTHGNS